MAVNTTVLPATTFAGFGATVMDCNEGAGGGAVTVRDAVPLMPDNVAVIVTGPPPATPVATPVVLTTVARVVLFELHPACVVRFWVELSE